MMGECRCVDRIAAVCTPHKNNAAPAAFHPRPRKAPSMSATIYGTIKDSVTGQLITTASVVAPGYTVNCQNGSYSFLTPGAATVTVTASDVNYVSQSKPITVTNGQVKSLNFALVHK